MPYWGHTNSTRRKTPKYYLYLGLGRVTDSFSFYVFVNEYMYDTSVNKYPETDRRKIGITMLEKIVLNLYGRGMKFYN